MFIRVHISNEIFLRNNLIIARDTIRSVGRLSSRQRRIKFFERAECFAMGKAFIALRETIFQHIGNALA